MRSTAVDESLSSMNQQFCSRENQLLQVVQQNEKSTQTIVLFIRHLLNNEITKQVAGAKTIQSVRHPMTLAKEPEIKLQKYKVLSDDDMSVKDISINPESDLVMMPIQNKEIKVKVVTRIWLFVN